MKFITDSGLNNLTQKINSIFRVDSHNKIKHNDLDVREVIGDKIRISTNKYTGTNASIYNETFIQFHDSSTDAAIKAGYTNLYGTSNPKRQRLFVVDGTHDIELRSLDNHSIKLKNNTLITNFRNIKFSYSHLQFGYDYNYLADGYLYNHEIGTTRLVHNHARGVDRQNELLLTICGSNHDNPNDSSQYEALQIRQKSVYGHNNTYSRLALKGNVMANWKNIYAVNELYADDIKANSYIHSDEYYCSDRIHVGHFADNGRCINICQDSLMIESEYRISNRNTGKFESLFEASNRHFHIKYRDYRYTNDCTTFTICQDTIDGTYYSNINLRAGKSCKIDMIGNCPTNNMSSNALQRINVYGSIYFPKVNENTPGVDFTQYTLTQINQFNKPLQGIILDLIKQNESLQSQIDTLITQLNNLS